MPANKPNPSLSTAMLVRNLPKKLFLVFVAFSVIVACSCKHNGDSRNRLDENNFPRTILWAWERPEDLRFIDPQRFAVAFLAQTLVLKGGSVIATPRRQSLELPPNIKLIAVTRIESQKATGERPLLSDLQRQKLRTLILKTIEIGNVAGIQIDFDSASSEREFYRALLQELRGKLPDKLPLTMTALASFCIGDRWLDDLPVDEAVPMVFRMGADEQNIRRFLAGGDDFREPLCRRSFGVALDEPVDFRLNSNRRVYVFNSHSWTKEDLALLNERFLK